MAQLKTTQINGTITASQASTDPSGLVRNQELATALAAKSDVGHVHLAADVTDLGAAVLQAIGNWLAQASGDLAWQWSSGVGQSALSGVLVNLATGGGLVRGLDGLAVDPELIAELAAVAAADVSGLSDVVTSLVLDQLVNSATLHWVPGSGIAGQVQVQSNGGLRSGDNGLTVDFGTSHTQAAHGDHTHSQLHDALTLAPSSTLTVALSGQELAAELNLMALGGLLATASGVAVDLGTSHTQAAYGDHTHALSSLDFGPGGAGQWVGELLTDSSTVGWLPGTGSALQASVKLDLSTGAGHAPLGLSGEGLYVVLGSGVAQAAPGNHGHSVATTAAAGLMSAADKLALLALLAAPGLMVDPPLQLASGVVTLPPATHFAPGYMSSADKIKVDAFPGNLTFATPLTMDSLGTVSLPAATAGVDGYMTADQASHLAALWAATSPRVTVTDWGFMDPADKAKLDAQAVISSVASPMVLTSGVLGIDTSGLGGAGITSVSSPLTLADGVLGIDTSGLGGGSGPTSVTAPLVLSAGVLSMPAATSTTDGYMSASDKANLAALAGFSGLNSGVINATMVFAGGLNPAIQFNALDSTHWDVRVDDGDGDAFNIIYAGTPALRLDASTYGLTSYEFNSYGGYKHNGTQVVGAQGAAVDNATGTGGSGSHTPTSGGYGFATSDEMGQFLDNVANAIAQLNTLLARCRAHGLIAT